MPPSQLAGPSHLCSELEPGLLPPFALTPSQAPRSKPSPSAPRLKSRHLYACPLRERITPSPVGRVKPSLTMCYPRCACLSPQWVKSCPRYVIHVRVPP
ncbi:hypothetical protein AMTR_s00087p00043070 [Amborella trichopoda]|uniref:Uncharacterized protein n=1 Tax=Amborella trichopoda TaxID=13333 RepID=W1P6F0_AMBTC|nr:hypothetical protein AMTR_s00087p00043070 [Amborella trichopoda]